MRKIFLFFAAMLTALAVNATTININAGTNKLHDALVSATAGDTIVLADGTYTENKDGGGGYLTFGKNVTVMAANDANPIIMMYVPAIIKGGARAEIKGLRFDATNLKQASWYTRFFYSDDESDNNRLIFEKCSFYNDTISDAGLYCSSSKKLDSLIINNCYFNNCTASCIYLANTSAKGLKITNSTFANVTKTSYSAGVIDIRATAAEVVIDHCTFYNCQAKNTDYGALKLCSNSTVSNCIFAMSASTGSLRTIWASDGLTVSAKNCMVHNYTNDSGYGMRSVVSKTACSIADPLFVNAAEGNLTLGTGSPALGAGTDGSNLGDPRWWPAPKTIYCKVTADWWNWDYSNKTAVAAYAWNGTHSAVKNAEWPGVKMTEVENENGVWSIELDAKYTQIIFTRILPDGTYKGVKTYDLTVPTNDNNMYTITRETFDWSSEQLAESDGAWGVFTPTVLEDITYYFVNNPEWGEVHAYAWDPVIAAWPGETAALVDGVTVNGYNVYSYTMKSNRLHIIFNDGTGGEGHQTANLDVEDGKPYFYKGTWYASASAIPANTLENGYYLVGDFADVPAWGVADLTAAKKFSVNPDNAAEYMLANVTLAADDSLKVAKVKDDEILSYAPTEANYVVDAAHAGVKTIYYRPAADGGEGWWYNCIYVPKNDGTALDNTAVADKAQKFMENGQLFIRRDGKIYTTTGVQVK